MHVWMCADMRAGMRVDMCAGCELHSCDSLDPTNRSISDVLGGHAEVCAGHVSRQVCRHVLYPIHSSVHDVLDMRMDMCVDIRMDMCMGTCMDICAGMYTDMCMGICADRPMNMCIDTRIDIRAGMCTAKKR